MEYYRSTLATTAAAVFGLIAAARVLHPGNYEERSRPARPVAVPAAASALPDPAWVAGRIDLPFDLYLRPSARVPEMVVLAPRMAAALPAGLTTPAQPAETAAPAGRPQRAAAARRLKVAQRTGRARQATAARARAATASPTRGAAADVPSRDLAGGQEG